MRERGPGRPPIPEHRIPHGTERGYKLCLKTEAGPCVKCKKEWAALRRRQRRHRKHDLRRIHSILVRGNTNSNDDTFNDEALDIVRTALRRTATKAELEELGLKP